MNKHKIAFALEYHFMSLMANKIVSAFLIWLSLNKHRFVSFFSAMNDFNGS